MKTVVVTNNSGTTLNVMGKRIKPLREFVGDQDFNFETHEQALAFETFINQHPVKSLKALYSATAEELAGEGIVMTTDATSDEEVKALAAKLEKENDKAQLLALAESLELVDYADLNKGPLALLVAQAQLTK